MRRIFASAALLIVSALGGLTYGQPPAPASGTALPNNAVQPRVYITDSNSWDTHGGSISGMGLAGGVFGGGSIGSSAGGARPQTAEVIKTFGTRCPLALVNNRPNMSDYVVKLDHEGGKGPLSHKNKIVVFVQTSGDSIFSTSTSTLSLGGSVQDACAAILAHWSAHSAELKVAAIAQATAPLAPPPIVVQTAAVTTPGVTIDAGIANCDIEVDGEFMGNTPSTLNLAPGKHDILVKKTGYQDWTRSMTVANGAIRVSADMVAVQ